MNQMKGFFFYKSNETITLYFILFWNRKYFKMKEVTFYFMPREEISGAFSHFW